MNDHLHTIDLFAMGSHISVWLECGDASRADDALSQVRMLFATAEARMTRFSPDSELAHLNARSGQWVKLSSELYEVVQRAIEMAEETGGLFDPTMLNALESAGYSRSYEQIRTSAAVGSGTRERGNFHRVRLEPAGHAVRLPQGTRLDLGGIGKGYTAQQAVRFLSEWGPSLVDAGGDLTAGAAPGHWPGWPVGIAAPWSDGQEGENLMRLWLRQAALATSGVDYRRWELEGRAQHHIIDPRTGRPAETDALTVSVLADDACSAEAWATASLVAGVRTGSELLAGRGMAAALIDHDGRVVLTPALQPLVQWEPSLS